MPRRLLSALVVALVAWIGTACGSNGDEEGGGDELGSSDDEVRESVSGPVAKTTDAEVWTVENAWADTNTPNAKKAGIAWGANSGLSWSEKYKKWIDSFTKVAARGWGKTIRFKTPEGRVFDGPALECADVAIWMRMTFAAFHHLPFYLTGYQNGRAIHMGHMGIVDSNGDPIPGYPLFKTQYDDYEATWQTGSPWPRDASLHRRHVGDDDGANGIKAGDATLGTNDGAGAYMDQLFLNKRVGYLYLYLDPNFGSLNLADGANMFHIKAEATSLGDALLERWQKKGIGHTLPVVSSRTLASGKLRLQIASGSMPRRQPNWEEESTSGFYFQNDITGGTGQTSDTPPIPYAKLGGGIRRFRTAINVNGRWFNNVAAVDRPVYIEDGNIAAISERPTRFKFLLAPDSPDGTRDAALATIDSARTALRDKPSSCTQRTKREDAFQALYQVMQQSFHKTKAETDKQYRKLEDFVFAELEYNASKTCCWNGTTSQMADIVLNYAQKEKTDADARGVCQQPTVFKASGGGKYDTWKQYATTLGRTADWKAWSEDEPCTQRNVAEDTLGAHGNVAMCQ